MSYSRNTIHYIAHCITTLPPLSLLLYLRMLSNYQWLIYLLFVPPPCPAAAGWLDQETLLMCIPTLHPGTLLHSGSDDESMIK